MEAQGIIPFTELDIKKMKGDWESFYRLRIGKIRLLFTIDAASGDIEVHTIGPRGNRPLANYVALTLNPSPNFGRRTLNLAPLLSNLGEGAGG